jgi:hypothetical protein
MFTTAATSQHEPGCWSSRTCCGRATGSGMHAPRSQAFGFFLCDEPSSMCRPSTCLARLHLAVTVPSPLPSTATALEC